MKRSTLCSMLGSLLLGACSNKGTNYSAIPYDAELEAKVEKTLKRMTLEEKIGQMTQLNIDCLEKNVPGHSGFQLDEAKMDTVFRIYKVGSILNCPPAYGAQTLESWNQIIGRIQEKSMKEIGIPCIYGLDQNHGTTYTQGGTLFPQNINVAATFNREVARRGGEITAYETRASNTPWTFSPTLDLVRTPLWPRMWENFGEDCYMNAEMGKAMTLGFQGNDPNHVDNKHIAACLKHYLGYGAPVSGKDRTPAIIAPHQLREKFFAPYEAALRSGALSIMVNSGSVNGVPVHASTEWLTKWVKEDLNWDGVILTDWHDIDNLWTREMISADKKEAIMKAINAGIDMSMDPYEVNFCTLLKELVDEKKVSMERIDDATRRVLRLKYRLGLFDHPVTNYKDYPKFASKEHAEVSLHSAEESIVLLKNEKSILPLKKGQKILITGPNANQMRCLNGGWSYTWQGEKADEFAQEYHTIFEAMCEKFGVENVVLSQGVTYNEKGLYWQENEPQIEAAVNAARKVDVVVACIGENTYCESPGNLTDDLRLSQQQSDLVKALAKTGKPIVLVLNEGRPRVINDIEPLSNGVVHMMLPGNYGGDALANLLSGEVDFSGRMPYTYPRFANLLMTYDYKPSEHVGKVMEGAYNYTSQVSFQWPFGYGLSYNKFSYSNFKVNKKTFKAEDELVFTIDVKNEGQMVGKHSVLLFSSDLLASLIPDIRRLRQFEKVELQPGETKTVKLKIKASELAFVGYDGRWILEEGKFKMQTGDQVMTISCDETKIWNSPIR